jgi:hypothetical protein
MLGKNLSEHSSKINRIRGNNILKWKIIFLIALSIIVRCLEYLMPIFNMAEMKDTIETIRTISVSIFAFTFYYMLLHLLRLIDEQNA